MIKAPQLPSSWALAPLDAVAELNPRSFSVLPGAESRAVHFVPMAAVSEEFGGIDVSQSRPLSEVRKGYTSFTANDVLFAKITPCMENGKIALVPTLPNHIAYGSTEFHVLRPCEAVEPKWLAHFLSQKTFRELARQNMTGSAGQMRVPTSWLSAAQLPVAPRTEQSRIVEKLEELLSDLDAGVVELKAAQKKLALYRQSLLKAAVEGALTADWRARRATRGEALETGADLLARILTGRRACWEARQLAKFKEQGKTPPKGWQDKYPEPLKAGNADPSRLPAGWTWVTIDQLAHVGTGVTPLRSNAKFFDQGTIPWVTSGALNSEWVAVSAELVTDEAVKECRLDLYPAGTLLVAMYGEGKTRGKCAELTIPATINQAIAALVLEPAAQACKAYLKSFLFGSYEKMREQASGGVQPNLNLQIIKAIALPLPPIDEQVEIAVRLERAFDFIERQQAAVETTLKQSAAQRNNLLKAAFSGQLVPQDPNDEPASALLARIRAEREARESPRQGRRVRKNTDAHSGAAP